MASGIGSNQKSLSETLTHLIEKHKILTETLDRVYQATRAPCDIMLGEDTDIDIQVARQRVQALLESAGDLFDSMATELADWAARNRVEEIYDQENLSDLASVISEITENTESEASFHTAVLPFEDRLEARLMMILDPLESQMAQMETRMAQVQKGGREMTADLRDADATEVKQIFPSSLSISSLTQDSNPRPVTQGGNPYPTRTHEGQGTCRPSSKISLTGASSDPMKTDLETQIEKREAEFQVQLQKVKAQAKAQLRKEKSEMEAQLQKEKAILEDQFQKEKAELGDQFQKQMAEAQLQKQMAEAQLQKQMAEAQLQKQMAEAQLQKQMAEAQLQKQMAEAQLQKEDEADARLQKQMAEARLLKELTKKEARHQKEKADVKAQLQKEKAEVEAQLQKEKAEVEARLQKEKDEAEARLQKEGTEAEVQLQKKARLQRELAEAKLLNIMAELQHIELKIKLWAKFTQDCVHLCLVGETGSGKSSTGNSILGREEFLVSDCGHCVTTCVSCGCAGRFDRFIRVVDGPRIDVPMLDGKENAEKMTEEMRHMLLMSPQGFHAMLLVLKYGPRFTGKGIVTTLKHLFGRDFVRDFCIIIFTGGDVFDIHNRRYPGRTFASWLQDRQGPLQELIQECDNRAVLFNNLQSEEVEAPVKELLKMVDGLKTRGIRFTREMLQEEAATR